MSSLVDSAVTEQGTEQQNPGQSQNAQKTEANSNSDTNNEPTDSGSVNAESLLDSEQLQVPDKFKNEDGSINTDALLKSYLHAEKRLGAGDAPPKDPEEYKLESELSFEVDAERMKSFKKGAHAVGINNKQINYILQSLDSIITEGQQVTQQSEAKAVAEADKFLKEQWQDEYGGNLEHARKAFDYFKGLLPPQMQERLMAERNKLGNMPGFLALAAAIGKELGEDKQPIGGQSAHNAIDITALMKSEAYVNRKHPEHDRVKAQVEEAFKKGFKL